MYPHDISLKHMSNTYPQVTSGKQGLAFVPKCPAEFKFRAAHVPLSSLQPRCPSAKALPMPVQGCATPQVKLLPLG